MTQDTKPTGRAIRTQYPVNCYETGQLINTGELCIWYKATGRTYHINSPQGIKFKEGES